MSIPRLGFKAGYRVNFTWNMFQKFDVLWSLQAGHTTVLVIPAT